MGYEKYHDNKDGLKENLTSRIYDRFIVKEYVIKILFSTLELYDRFDPDAIISQRIYRIDDNAGNR